MKLGGVDELLQELTRLPTDLAADARAQQAAMTEQAAAAIRAAYPLGETGALRASVHVVTDGSTSPARVFAAVVVDAPYAELVEFGTVRTAPVPAFVPATRRGREQFVAAMVARVRAAGLQVDGA
jgi:HK97 gp10 family phage protein